MRLIRASCFGKNQRDIGNSWRKQRDGRRILVTFEMLAQLCGRGMVRVLKTFHVLFVRPHEVTPLPFSAKAVRSGLVMNFVLKHAQVGWVEAAL